MKTIRIFQWIEKKRFIFRIVTTLVTLLLLAVIYLFVYMTGGIKFVFSHSMYLPILLSGCVFGIKGGGGRGNDCRRRTRTVYAH